MRALPVPALALAISLVAHARAMPIFPVAGYDAGVRFAAINTMSNLPCSYSREPTTESPRTGVLKRPFCYTSHGKTAPVARTAPLVYIFRERLVIALGQSVCVCGERAGFWGVVRCGVPNFVKGF